jgi:hypothetical protein
MDHINYVINKCTKLCFALASVAKNKWGINSNSLKHMLQAIYKAAIEPIFLYSCSAFEEALNKKTIVNKLISFQRKIALRIIKGYRTISMDASLIISGLTSLNLTMKEKSQLYYIKNRKKFKELNIHTFVPFDSRPHPSEGIIINYSDYCESAKYDLNIFSDGSKQNSKVGSAYVIFDKFDNQIESRKFRLNDNCVYHDECLSIRTLCNFKISSPQR